MPRNAGVKMLAMQRMTDRQGRSEYSGGDRRMIGYSRNEYDGGARSEYGGGARSEYTGAMYPRTMYPGTMYPSGMAPVEPPMMIGDYRMPYPVENRRRSPRTGRFIRSEYDEPETRMGGYDRYRTDGYDAEAWDDGPQMHAGNGMKKPAADDYYAAAMWKMPKGEHRGPEHAYRELDEKTVNEWVKKLENADGTKGPHYKIDQVDQWRSINCMDCEKWEFFAVVNMMYADYCKTAEKMGINKIDFYGNLAKDFLHDPDATPNKFQKYMEYIAA